VGTFEVRYTWDTFEDLKRFSRRDRGRIMDEIELSLKHETTRF